MTFPEIIEQYGAGHAIPNAVLGPWLVGQQETLATVRRDKLLASELGQEVRRRAKADLFFLSRYVTWGTNAESAGRTLDENLLLEETHQRLCDFFVTKDDNRTIAEQDTIKSRMLLWPRGGLKALDVETLIPTPDGFRRMSDLTVGDKVFGADGMPCNVTGVSPVYKDRPCYEIIFSSGETIVADAGHLWETDARRDRDKRKRPRVKANSPCPKIRTTQEIASSVIFKQGATWSEANHRVRVARPVYGVYKEFTISPYALGCWLGDGTSAAGQITCADEQIIDEIRNEGEVIRKSDTLYRWVFNGGPDHSDYSSKSASFSARLRHLGVLNNKHIPAAYLRASIDQRMALLQGLMDTDGTVDMRGQCHFDNMNRTLAEQTKELIASLGFKPSLTTHRAVLDGRIIGDAYCICFKPYANRPVFRLARKRKRLQSPKKNSLQGYRQIVDVRSVPPREVKCISVDSQDHLYLAGEGFIPTHNSTVSVCDCAQWILNFPDIRILVLTAADDLATGFVGEVKGHFIQHNDTPSLMNIFFPEFCIDSDAKESAFEFTCPLWAAKKIKRKEPTVLASSIGSTLSGWHFEIVKADDVVSNKNSESELQCRKVTKNLGVNRKTLRSFGYFDKIGTRYQDFDDYGEELDKNVGDVKVVEDGPCVTMIENTSTATKILIGRAMVIKPERAKELDAAGKTGNYREAGEDGVNLLLPKLLSYPYLVKEWSKDDVSFEGQYNQNPKSIGRIVFDRGKLIQATVPFEGMPLRGPVSQTWDFAFSKKKRRDFCTGASAMWDAKGTMFVHDLVRDRYLPSDLAKAVVGLARKWHPFIVGIEDAAGSRLLEPTIIAEADACGDKYVAELMRRIDWFPTDHQLDAKRLRMEALQPWLAAGRLKFACYLPHLQALYDEFQKCTFGYRNDDIPDVLSQQPRYAPRMQLLVANNETSTFSSAQAAWNIMFEEGTDAFGRIGAGGPMPMPIVSDDPGDEIRAVPYGDLPAMLGAGLGG